MTKSENGLVKILSFEIVSNSDFEFVNGTIAP
jgi:hypothetical protein